MNIILERVSSLFEVNTTSKLLRVVKGTNLCHWNSATVCYLLRKQYQVDYCEGYINGDMGHAWNVYTDPNGTKHYFDITQEWNITNGVTSKFDFNLELVKEFSCEEITDIFDHDGYSHLVCVETIKGLIKGN